MYHFNTNGFFVRTQQRLIQALVAFPLLAMTGLNMSCDASSPAADSSHFGVERVVVPAYDRAASDVGIVGRPLVVIPMDDGNAVVAGGGGIASQIGISAATVAKVDSTGTVLWSHMMGSPDKLEDGRRPRYYCGTSMVDGSIILAGQIPESFERKKNKIDRGILTHLDANGKVLSEQLIVPKEKSMWRGTIDFLDCVRCADKVALLAYVHNVVEFSSKEKPDGVDEHFYMLFLLDKTGSIQQETIIDLPPQHSWKTIGGGMLTYLKDEGFVVTAQDMTGKTTLFKMDMAGKVTGQKNFNGAPPMVRSSGQDAIVQFCFFDNGCPTLRTYDKDLKEVSTVQYQKWPASEFFVSSVHRTSEGYFFAASADHGRPFVAYMKDATSKIEMVGIGDKGDNTPSVYVRAAAPGKKPGEFVVAPDVQSRHIVFLQAPVALSAAKPTVPAKPIAPDPRTHKPGLKNDPTKTPDEETPSVPAKPIAPHPKTPNPALKNAPPKTPDEETPRDNAR